MQPSVLQIWIKAIRPKTLWAAFAPVLVGTAMAIEEGLFHPLAAFLALFGALCIQIGTNFYNDFADFEKGADTSDRKGPTRVTQAGWVTPVAMKRATIFVFCLAVASGVYLMWKGGLPIVVIGILSILAGVMYTAGKYSLAYIGLGDLFVLIFFGPVAVGGTYYVQALSIHTTVLIAGLAPGLLAVAILLVNNIRDQAEDRIAGKKTLVVRLGHTFGLVLYAFCIIGTAAIPVILFIEDKTHTWVLISVIILVPGLFYLNKIMHTDPGTALNPLLGATARLLLVYSIVFAITWNI